MKRTVAGFILAFLLAGLIGAPLAARAQLFSSVKLPACDQVVYELVDKEKARDKKAERINVSLDDYYGFSPEKRNLYTIVGTKLLNPCGIQDFVQLFVNVTNWGFSVLIIISFFFMIWGGFILLISAGRTEYVQNGKKILSGAVLGTLIVLVSWVLVYFFIQAFTGTYPGKATIFPGQPEAKEGLSGASGCRVTFRQKFPGIQNSCQQKDKPIRLNCADPETTDGAVTNLQGLLLRKGCDCGPVDGCFGKQTALCLWNFMLSNSLSPPPRIEDTQTWPYLIQQLKSETSKSCNLQLGINVIEPDIPDPDINLPPLQNQSGCCVTNDPTLLCVDNPTPYCDGYQPPLDPESEGTNTYSFVDRPCDQIPMPCQQKPGYCLSIRDTSCREVTSEANCEPFEAFGLGECP